GPAGPGRALGLLALLGAVFAVVTLVVGDYVAPQAERQGLLLEARIRGGVPSEGAGAWLKERRATGTGERSFSINVAGIGAGGALQGVRIFEFDDDGRLVTQTEARAGTVDAQRVWHLQDVRITQWPQARAAGTPTVQEQRLAAYDWPSTLAPAVVAAAVQPLQAMNTLELWRYSRHLGLQEQATQRYELQFWKRAFYPWACLVMVALALPFAYLHARAGGISFKVFGGIMLGIGFVLLNNLAGHIGLLSGWLPWLTAAAPSLLLLLLSLAAFGWLVRYR
ncbi:MAG: LptF/LptG family permease, partial [Comamonadaceae bacterium]|nr:LptF/LptG family permease [Comamonadaceae bacterium]